MTHYDSDWAARATFSEWFEAAMEEGTGTDLALLYDVEDFYLVNSRGEPFVPAVNTEYVGASVLAATLVHSGRAFRVANFVVADVTSTHMKVRVYDLFSLHEDGMTYIRESGGVPWELEIAHANVEHSNFGDFDPFAEHWPLDAVVDEIWVQHRLRITLPLAA